MSTERLFTFCLRLYVLRSYPLSFPVTRFAKKILILFDDLGTIVRSFFPERVAGARQRSDFFRERGTWKSDLLRCHVREQVRFRGTFVRMSVLL